ncbi:MAG: murein hydrolase activator EnvC family protein [bacterium]
MLLKEKYFFVRLYCILIFSLFVHGGFTQTKEDLQRKKEENQREIALTNKMLGEVRSDKKQTLSKLRIIQKRVQLRKNLLSNIDEEISDLNNKLEEKYFVINLLKNDVENIKEEYAKLIQYAWKNRKTQNNLMFILSAESFNQAFKRLRYLQQYADYRKKQARVIVEMEQIIADEVKNIQNKVQDKQILMAAKKDEVQELTNEKDKSRQMVQNLKSKEDELLKRIEEKRRIAQNLEDEIQKIIAEEARKADGEEIYAKLTPEEKLISDEFSQNKGKLPWPTQRGVITSDFGKHKHPVLDGVFINNNGVDISTVKGESVRAVFNGVVSKIIPIKGANFTVILRHGNFLSVYQNLVNIRVNEGDQLKVRDIIGDVFYNADDDNCVIHFEIWKELEKLDPSDWLVQGNN